MKQIPLGPGGPMVGVVGYGCWRFVGHSVNGAEALIETALDLGMTLVDTADIYGYGTAEGFGAAEALLGRVLAANPGLRARMVLATKGGVDLPTPYNNSYDYLIAACDASLARLGVDGVDLYQVHRPDLLAPIAEVTAALETMIASGRARAVGVSNFTPAQVRALQAHLSAPLVCNQVELSALRQAPISDGTLDLCQETGSACIAWSPLAGGALATGNVAGGYDADTCSRVNRVIARLAETYGASPSQIALAFVLRHPARICALVGTQTPGRLYDAAGAAHITLQPRDWYDLIEAQSGTPMP